jgi:hypothetical protein
MITDAMKPDHSFAPCPACCCPAIGTNTLPKKTTTMIVPVQTPSIAFFSARDIEN